MARKPKPKSKKEVKDSQYKDVRVIKVRVLGTKLRAGMYFEDGSPHREEVAEFKNTQELYTAFPKHVNDIISKLF